MHPLCHAVLKFIRKHDLVRPGHRISVAVSGGADSVALLRILVELRDELGTVLSVAHFNHKMRGAESDADEEFVRKLAALHDLPLTREADNVVSYATENKLGIEAAARKLRYDFFHRLLSAGNLDKIATAHTLDDQAETVLLKLLRGAGTRGLAGVFPSVGDHAGIVRPLIAVRRPEVEAYLRDLKQEWREDASNSDLRHTRNRLRHQILPELEKQVNPRVRETLAEAAEIARVEEEFWAEQIRPAFQQSWNEREDGGSLCVKLLREYPMAMQRRLVRAAGEALGLGLEFQHVEEVLALAKPGARASLPAHWIATLQDGLIRFQVGHVGAEDYVYPLLVPGRVSIAEAGVVIEAHLIESVNSSSDAACLISCQTVQELVVRNWRPADRFWPAHTKEPKKVKELLQDRHIVGREKKLWPVVASADDVLWVRGMGVGRQFQAKDGKGVLIRDTPINAAKGNSVSGVSAPGNVLQS